MNASSFSSIILEQIETASPSTTVSSGSSARASTALQIRGAAFIEPMECLAVSKLPEGSQWLFEIKLDGFRALGIKSNGSVRLLSRRNNFFNRQYPLVESSFFVIGEGFTLGATRRVYPRRSPRARL